jgi:hypothetical protein
MAKGTKKAKASTPRASKNRVAAKSRKPRPKTQIAAAPNKDIGGQDPSGGSSQNASAPAASPEVLNRLWTIIDSRKGLEAAVSHSARFLAKGTAQVVQKLGELLASEKAWRSPASWWRQTAEPGGRYIINRMIAECQRANAEPRRQRDTALARRSRIYADRLTAAVRDGRPAAAGPRAKEMSSMA